MIFKIKICKKESYICNPRALSSVGSEHLVYTQGVGGSNPSAPTFPNPLVKQKAYL